MSETPLTPRTNLQLFGQEAAEEAFLSAYTSGRMHHAWLISGPKGIGKATLAYRAARMVLSGSASMETDAENPAIKRILAGSHTDLLTLEAAYDAEKDETKNEIPVDAARAVPGFLSLTPAESAWRVVVIDSIDDLNVNAANAILKILEEPPPRALLLLISHQPGKLLPTIRSRCRALKLPALAPEHFRRALRLNAPEMELEEMEMLGLLSHYSPGMALELKKAEALELYASFLETVTHIARSEPVRLLPFADAALSGPVHTRWRVLGFLAGRLVEQTVALGLNSARPERLLPGEQEAAEALLALRGPEAWAQFHPILMQQFSLAVRLHLDYKTLLATLMQAFKQPELALTA